MGEVVRTLDLLSGTSEQGERVVVARTVAKVCEIDGKGVPVYSQGDAVRVADSWETLAKESLSRSRIPVRDCYRDALGFHPISDPTVELLTSQPPPRQVLVEGGQVWRLSPATSEDVETFTRKASGYRPDLTVERWRPRSRI